MAKGKLLPYGLGFVSQRYRIVNLDMQKLTHLLECGRGNRKELHLFSSTSLLTMVAAAYKVDQQRFKNIMPYLSQARITQKQELKIYIVKPLLLCERPFKLKTRIFEYFFPGTSI